MADAKIIGFYLPTDENGCFSSRYPAQFRYGGVLFENVVQYLVYHKVMLSGRYDIARQVMNMDDSEKIMELGADEACPEFTKIRNKWHWIRRVVARRAVYAKFMQHPELRKKLLATENAILCECSHGDKTWGVGISLHDMRWKKPENWTGHNYLGNTLMEVRDEIRQLGMSLNEDRMIFEDAYDAGPNQEWSVSAAALTKNPAYVKSVMAYVDTFANNFTRQNFMESGKSLADWEEQLRSGAQAAIPALGFFDLKQDVYDISRRLGANTRHDRVHIFCSQYLSLLDAFRRDPGLNAWAKSYQPKRPGDKHAGLARMIYSDFVTGAREAGLTPSDYYETIDASSLDIRMISNPEDAWIRARSRRELLACTAWHFRADYFAEGALIRHSIGDGVLVRFFEALL